jgi:Acyl-coenzyme A:6-aminopenicillanic acid acyl-transferase
MENITDLLDFGGRSWREDADDTHPSSSAAPQRHAFGSSTLKVKDGIWHLRVRESGYHESGLAIGRLLSSAEYPGVRFLRRRRVRFIINLVYAATKRDFARIRIPKCYLEELDGYAEGSGISYETLFFLNFVFDILKKYGFHCSSVAITKPGVTLVGRNTDLLPWIAKAALRWFPPVVLDISVPGKLRYVQVTLGLLLGVLSGFNERGVAMMSHQMAATKEKAIPGNLATTLLQRMILEEATDMAHAESVIRANPIQRCISNLVTSSAEGTSCVYEITPTSVKTTCASGPFLCCATHFEDPELSSLHRNEKTASERRLSLMNALAADTRAVPEEVIAMMRNYDNGLEYTKSGYSPTNNGTCQSMVFDVIGRRVFVSDGTRLPVSLSGRYREIIIDDD